MQRGLPTAEPPPAGSVSPGPLSANDRELLVWHLAAAAREVFPDSERIGKTAQQDFYFRELLDRLLLNFEESQEPLTGGNLDEIWSLTHATTPKWRTRAEAKRRRSGYDRGSMKTLVHEWCRAVSSRSRTYRKRGVIEFFVHTPDVISDDVVLFATISNFPLTDGQIFSVATCELTETTRLTLPSFEDRDVSAEREMLLARASRIVRDVERKYLEKLRDAPLEQVAAEVETLERDKKRRDYRRLAASIVVVLGAGMAAYKILSVNHFVPMFDVSRGHRNQVVNVIGDRMGHVALADNGKPASGWVNTIVDNRGNGAQSSPEKPGWLQLSTDEASIVSKIPSRWKQDDSTVLPSEGTCFRLQNDDGEGAIVGCNVLYDLRSIAPSLSGNTVTLAGDFDEANGVTDRAITVYEHHDVTCVNMDCSRIRLWMLHGYKKNGQYDVHLVVCHDRDPWKGGTHVDGIPITRLTIRNGDLTAVEPVGGDHFELAWLPPELKLRPVPPPH